MGLAGAQTPPNPACELQPPLRWLHPDGETPSGRRRWLHQSSGERRGHEENVESSPNSLYESSVDRRFISGTSGLGATALRGLLRAEVFRRRDSTLAWTCSGADEGYVRAMDASTPPNRSDWHTGGIAR